MVQTPRRVTKTPGSINRRSHRKSRNGCLECKQRHVKCDESRPSCVNCSVVQRSCSFATSPMIREHSQASPAASSSGADTAPSTASSSVYSPASFGAVIEHATYGEPELVIGSGSNTSSLEGGHYELEHLALLHHLEKNLRGPGNTSFIPPNGTDGTDAAHFADFLLTSALSTPYLMDELLAISALHISTETSDIEKKQQLHHQAAQLQMRALSVFNTTRPSVSVGNAIPMFLFSSLLGLHSLFDSINPRRDFTDFLDKFIQFLSLQHGIRTVTGRGWPTISQTEMRQIIDPISEQDERQSGVESHGPECDQLLDELTSESGSLGHTALNACREAVRSLQWIIEQRRGLPEHLRTHVVLAWPVLITSEFIKMLKQRRPESLVILAHWATLLHQDREFWVFGGGGRFLIESTSKYLGAYWDEWLRWPLKVLEDSD